MKFAREWPSRASRAARPFTLSASERSSTGDGASTLPPYSPAATRSVKVATSFATRATRLVCSAASTAAAIAAPPATAQCAPVGRITEDAPATATIAAEVAAGLSSGAEVITPGGGAGSRRPRR